MADVKLAPRKHGRKMCKTCPFRLSYEGGAYFPPDVLDASIGSNLREGYVHKCHSAEQNLCVGNLRFADKHADQYPSGLMALGKSCGLIRLDEITEDAPIAESWEEVLAYHALHEALDPER